MMTPNRAISAARLRENCIRASRHTNSNYRRSSVERLAAIGPCEPDTLKLHRAYRAMESGGDRSASLTQGVELGFEPVVRTSPVI